MSDIIFTSKVDLLIYSQSYENLEELEYSNKIILDSNILNKLLEIDDNICNNKMFFKLFNDTDFGYFEVYVGVHDFSANNNKIFLPNKIAEELFVIQDSDIKLEYCVPPKGSYIKLKPHSKDFYDIIDVKNILENNIQKNYPILQQDLSISIKYNNKIIELDIIECRPYEVITTDNTDIEVEFVSIDEEIIESSDLSNNNIQKEEEKEEKENEKSNNKSIFIPFSGKGYKLGSE